MPYSWNGVCYAEPIQALEAFSLAASMSDTNAIVSLTEQPTITETGLITWTIAHRPLTDTASTVRTGTTQLLPCSVPKTNQWPIETLVWICAVFFAAVLGFRCGFRG